MEEAKRRSSDPNGFVVLVATAIRDAGRPEEAEKYFREVIQSDSNATEAYVELGVTLAEKGQFDKAIPMFAKAVGLAPKDARIWNFLGAARRHNGGAHFVVSSFLFFVLISAAFLILCRC
jgi:tetratricopeptide (TPR) repeat protein